MLLAILSPTAALLLFTFGVALIYIELNRPGSVLPGALGLCALLLAAATLAMHHPTPLGLALLTLAALLLFLDLLRPTHVVVAALATFALALGFHILLNPLTDAPIATPAAIACGLFLGAGTAVLTRIARRARTNKGLD